MEVNHHAGAGALPNWRRAGGLLRQDAQVEPSHTMMVMRRFGWGMLLPSATQSALYEWVHRPGLGGAREWPTVSHNTMHNVAGGIPGGWHGCILPAPNRNTFTLYIKCVLRLVVRCLVCCRVAIHCMTQPSHNLFQQRKAKLALCRFTCWYRDMTVTVTCQREELDDQLFAG